MLELGVHPERCLQRPSSGTVLRLRQLGAAPAPLYMPQQWRRTLALKRTRLSNGQPDSLYCIVVIVSESVAITYRTHFNYISQTYLAIKHYTCLIIT